MNRFEICAAYHLVASHYHSGMGSKGYAILSRLSRMGFRPSANAAYGHGTETRNAAAALLWKRRAEIRRTW